MGDLLWDSPTNRVGTGRNTMQSQKQEEQLRSGGRGGEECVVIQSFVWLVCTKSDATAECFRVPDGSATERL